MQAFQHSQKTILVNCGGLTFSRTYSHVEAHQDEKVNWEELSREAQLNAACDSGAKTMIWKQDITDLPPQKPFPLEPICMFVERKKMTSDTRPHIRYAAGLQIAHSFFHETSCMFTNAFDEVAWPHVYRTLNEEVPRLFQVWACKQVMGISATNKNLSQHHWDGRSDKCPCCTIHVETAEHIMVCPEVGRVETFMQSSQALEQWMEDADTDPDLVECIMDYVQGRGTVTMALAVQNAPARFQALGCLQDKIGWRRFLEGMVSTKIVALQQQSCLVNGSWVSLDKWSSGLITRLLEITHGQWLYHNFIVNDPLSGIIATGKKEELILEIERQRELGDAGLLDEDKYLAEVNLGDIENTLGERLHYWLLAIKTVWKAKILQEQQERQQTVSEETM